MAIFVNTNVSSLNSTRQLGNATASLDTTYKRLASGMRINSAKDDAAGLQISNRLTSQINGLNQGNRNANDGIALAQTAEGALDEVHSMLQRVRTLAVQAANGTNTQEDRNSIQEEITSLCSEVRRIATKTTFAGKEILSGHIAQDGKSLLTDKGIIKFQVGANANDTIAVNLSAGFALSQMAAAKVIDTNGTNIADATAKAATGLIKNADGTVRFSVSDADAAQATLANIDKFIGYVDKKRGQLGAIQNRMESTVRNQSNIAENESDARSRIRDADYASEAANLSQQSIIQQAASSMLTQANSRPQLALSLLG